MWLLEKGGSGMIKKYQDMIGNILATFVDVVDEDKTYGFYHNSEHYYNTDYYTQNKHCFDELEKLAIEKDEQESRKDKLVVGSEWECVAVCLVAEVSSKSTLTSILTVLGDGCVFIGNDYLMTTIKVKDKHYVIPTSQFLLCFKPIEKEESE